MTAGGDGFARLWDAKSGKSIGSPISHDYLYLNSVDFSPDGTRFVTSGGDHAEIRDTETGEPVGSELRHESGIAGARFSPDGQYVFTAGWDEKAVLWCAVTGEQRGETLSHEKAVNSAQFSPDGRLIVTAGGDSGVVQVWDARNGHRIGAPLIHQTRVFDAHFNADGTHIITVGPNQVLREWNIANLLRVPTPVPGFMYDWAQAIAGLSFNEYGELIKMPPEQRLAILRNPPSKPCPWAELARSIASRLDAYRASPDSEFTPAL